MIEIFEIQVNENKGHILFEHPWSAHSWAEPVMERLYKLPGVQIYKGDQCPFQANMVFMND